MFILEIFWFLFFGWIDWMRPWGKLILPLAGWIMDSLIWLTGSKEIGGFIAFFMFVVWMVIPPFLIWSLIFLGISKLFELRKKR